MDLETFLLLAGFVFLTTLVASFAWDNRSSLGVPMATGIAIVELAAGVGAILWSLSLMTQTPLDPVNITIAMLWGLYSLANGAFKVFFKRSLLAGR